MEIMKNNAFNLPEESDFNINHIINDRRKSSAAKIVNSDIDAVEHLRRSFRQIKTILVNNNNNNNSNGIINNRLVQRSVRTKEVSCEAVGDYRKNITDVVEMLVYITLEFFIIELCIITFPNKYVKYNYLLRFPK